MEYEKLPHDHGENNIDSIQEISENIENFRVISDIFRQLGDVTRVRIFWILCHCEECVLNIAAMMHMSSPAVSHHLRLLKSSGLISSRREGKEVYYHVSDLPQSFLLHEMIEEVMKIACPDMDRLPADLDHRKNR